MIMSRAHRFGLSLPIVIAGVLLCGAVPAGQQGGSNGPTLSADLKQHSHGGPHKHRVIVQAPDSVLAVLRGGRLGLLKRELKGGAVALEVNDAQLWALERNPLIRHISGDLDVVADMAITNKVTHATDVWQGAQ